MTISMYYVLSAAGFGGGIVFTAIVWLIANAASNGAIRKKTRLAESLRKSLGTMVADVENGIHSLERNQAHAPLMADAVARNIERLTNELQTNMQFLSPFEAKYFETSAQKAHDLLVHLISNQPPVKIRPVPPIVHQPQVQQTPTPDINEVPQAPAIENTEEGEELFEVSKENDIEVTQVFDSNLLKAAAMGSTTPLHPSEDSADSETIVTQEFDLDDLRDAAKKSDPEATIVLQKPKKKGYDTEYDAKKGDGEK